MKNQRPHHPHSKLPIYTVIFTLLLPLSTHSFSTSFILPSRESPLKYAAQMKQHRKNGYSNGYVLLKETVERGAETSAAGGGKSGDSVLEDVDGIGVTTVTTVAPVPSVASAAATATLATATTTTTTDVDREVNAIMEDIVLLDSIASDRASDVDAPVSVPSASSTVPSETPSAATLVEEFLTADPSSSPPPSTSTSEDITVEDILTSATSVPTFPPTDEYETSETTTTNGMSNGIGTKDPPAVISEFLNPTPDVMQVPDDVIPILPEEVEEAYPSSSSSSTTLNDSTSESGSDVSGTSTSANVSTSAGAKDKIPSDPTKVDESIKKELLDPTLVVEDLIGSALVDQDRQTNTGSANANGNGGVGVAGAVAANGAISTPNLRQEAEASLVEASSTSSTSSTISTASTSSSTTTSTSTSTSIDTPTTTTPSKTKPLTYPTISKILKFAIPSIGVYLCSPLLSLIDTSSVGLLSGTVQQAALSPAVAITDYGALLVAFMYTATTNLVASAREADQDTQDKPKTRKSLLQALQLSGFVGTGLGLSLFLFARTLVKVMIGNEGIDPAVVSSAMNYVRVRALGMPAAVIIGSAQSACIGMQDVKSPMYVLVVAALVNLLGDVLFVPVPHAWIGGAAGAAWATVFSQYAAVAMFVKWLTFEKRPKKVNVTNAILELTGESLEGKSRRRKFRDALANWYAKSPAEDGVNAASSSSSSMEQEVNGVKESGLGPLRRIGRVGKMTPITQLFQKKKSGVKKNVESFSCKGFLANQFSLLDLFKLPKLKDAKEFWPYVIPVTTTSVGRVSSYCAMNHVVSSSLGTLAMAAHQIIVSLFYCLTPIADSLNLTGQSFVPGLYEKDVSKARSMAMSKTLQNFIKAGILFGIGMATIVGFIPLLGKFFTSDPIVMNQVNACAPFLSGIFLVHGIVCACEGMLLGQKDLGFLGKAYSLFFFAVPYWMLRVKDAALAGSATASITSIWKIFLGYNVVRASTFVARCVQLQIRRSKEASKMVADTTP